MAKKPKDEGAIYQVTIGGTYGAYADNGQTGFVEKPYEMTVRMSYAMINPPPLILNRTKAEIEAAKATEGEQPSPTKEVPALVAGPLSVFKHHFKDHMKRKYPDFQVWKMHEITKPTTRVDGQPVNNIRVMNREQLVAYADSEDLPVVTSMYEDIGTLRDAIERCMENEAAFVKSQNQLGTKTKPGIDMASEVAKMNPLTDLVDAVEDIQVVEDIINDTPTPTKNKGGRPKRDAALSGAGI